MQSKYQVTAAELHLRGIGVHLTSSTASDEIDSLLKQLQICFLCLILNDFRNTNSTLNNMKKNFFFGWVLKRIDKRRYILKILYCTKKVIYNIIYILYWSWLTCIASILKYVCILCFYKVFWEKTWYSIFDNQVLQNTINILS